MLPRTDDEHVIVLRNWFRNHPDLAFREELRTTMLTPAGKNLIRSKINDVRFRVGRPLISDYELDRLYALLIAGTE